MSEQPRVVLGGQLYAIERFFGHAASAFEPAQISQVAVDSKSYVHVLRRGPPPVAVFAPDGAFAYAYGEGEIFDSHGISIDAHDRVWVADRDAHQVLAFSREGARLMALGARHAPRWREPFNHPTRAAVAPDGEIVVADGYGNARLHRFSAEGVYLGGFGELGAGPGEFITPHSVIVDRDDRLLIADRENDRIQVFDRVGRWLAEWRGLCRPMDICQRADGAILVTDQVPSVTAFAPDGRRIDRGRPSPNGAHGIAISPDGAIYLAEINPTSVTKLMPVGAFGGGDRAV
jgi:DNA-binding beta-propeller fold protein YncE